MKNGPWQFDFNVILLSEFNGSVRPSDMVFDSLDIWVRVLDLPMDYMNSAYGEIIGGWIGKYIQTDVDDEGIAWGKDVRIRVAVRVDQPLLRGVPLKNSEEDDVQGNWFELKYEKIPHFCFHCGRLVHPAGGCQADKEDPNQWGEWLRASPGKSHKPSQRSRPSVSSGSQNQSRSSESDYRGRGGVSIRDIPPRRVLAFEQSQSNFSRTGGREQRREEAAVTSPRKMSISGSHDQRAGKALAEQDHRVGSRNDRTADAQLAMGEKQSRKGTYIRKPRQPCDLRTVEPSHLPPSQGRKRGTKQVWVQVPVRVVGDESSESAEKRQRTSSVFDRIEDGNGGATSVFDRLEDPAADPAWQGRRDQ
jgi:hypothetical protein